MRTLLILIVAAGASLAPVAALAQSPTTTRIETRPFYGAIVTLEEGVRVFRPLPPHDRVIINPGGATPLSLSYEERRSVSHNYNYSQSDTGGPVAVGGYGGGIYGSGHAGGHGRDHRHLGGVRGIGGGHHGGHHGGGRR
ncbi:MAG: hypothetical protein AB7O57_03690 [Hyphomicrobiaceae bacterium]